MAKTGNSKCSHNYWCHYICQSELPIWWQH